MEGKRRFQTQVRTFEVKNSHVVRHFAQNLDITEKNRCRNPSLLTKNAFERKTSSKRIAKCEEVC